MKKLFKVLFILLVMHCTINIDNCKAQWEPDVRLTNDTNSSYTSYGNARCVAANGDTVHVIWNDNCSGYFEIYHKCSTDGGVHWGDSLQLTNETTSVGYPSIAVSGPFVHVVWEGGYGEIYYKNSTDGGVSWGMDKRLTYNSATSAYPSISVSGSTVHIVWADFRVGDGEIYYIRSTNNGISWGVETRLTNNAGISNIPSVSVNGMFVHVVWYDERDGNSEIYYKRSTDGGVSWGADTRLTNNTSYSEGASISVSGQTVNVVWFDYRDGHYEIYYKRSSDGGVTWGAETRLTYNPSGSLFPCLASSGSIVHIVWEDYRNGNWEIYYKRSTNDGINWGTDTRLTNSIGYSDKSSIAVSGSAVHVVWQDTRNGSIFKPEIYYKLNPNGNSVSIQNISSEVPSQYSLYQNYPNPFNPTTKIKFDIPAKTVGQTFLSVYDILGKEVATIVNEQLAPGTYSVDWDASVFFSGVYFYRLSSGDFSDTKRMLLIK